MADYSRPEIPYIPPETLPNDDRYALVSAAGRSPTANDLDGDLNYIITILNTLKGAIDDVEAGVLVGSDDPENALKFMTTDGNGNPFWSKVLSNYIEDLAVVTGKINNGAITSQKIGNAQVTVEKLAPNSVTAAKIVDDAITIDKMANNSVGPGQLLDQCVSLNKILDATITAQKIANATITGLQIANNTITAQQIANNAITKTQLAPVVQPLIGGLFPWGGPATVAPVGYLFANGQQDVNRVTYALLFAVYGTTYGIGDGVNTFGLPDYRGRVIVGIDMSVAGTVAATNNQVTTATASALTVGGNGGFQQITLNETQIPAHTHTVNAQNGFASSGAGGPSSSPTAGATASGSTGGSQPHNNMSPFAFAQVLIYAGV